MQSDTNIKYAKDLVDIAIKQYNKKLLGKENILCFFENNLNTNLNNNDWNEVIYLFCLFLAKRGYEILKDIEHFNIIECSSDQYKAYCEKMLECLPDNFDTILKISKKVAIEIIKLYYSNDSFKEKNFDFYFNYVTSKINEITQNNKTLIYLYTVNYITNEYYDLKNVNPLILEKF